MRARDIWGICVNVNFKSPLENMRSDHLKSVFKMLNLVSVLDRLRKDNEESDTIKD